MHSLQMSLNNPLPQPLAVGSGLQRLTPLSPEAVMSQLDRIAAAEAPPPPSHGLGSMAGAMALLGGLIVVGMALMWRAPDEPARPAVAQAVAPTVAAVHVDPPRAADVSAAASLSAAPVQPPRAAPPEPLRAAPAPLLAAAPVRPEPAMAAAPAPVAKDDAVRKARAKQQAAAAARRKAAAQLAQEQAQAQEAQRLAVLAQSHQERAAQAAEDERRRLAAERKRAAAVVVAMDTSRRSVADACAGSGGFFGQHSCRARECSKAEHQGDMVCVRLRESEEVQRRASMER